MARGAKKAKPKPKKKTAKAKSKKPAAKKKPRAKKKKAAPVGVKAPAVSDSSDAIPQLITFDSTSERRTLTARERAIRALPVTEIVQDADPIGALRRFLDSIMREATSQQAQIAIGAAQLILMPIAREGRGGRDVQELVDLLLRHWDQFGERRKGYHAQEFLKHALFAIGIDRERARKLEELIPATASGELLFNLARAYAIARDKVAMLGAVNRALEAGVTPSQFRRDADFLVYASDSDLALLLAQAEVPRIPVNVEPHVPVVRAALDALVGTLREFGESIELRPPVRLDAILDAERTRKISLPNDYRALLTITNGMSLWDHTFFGAGDYREATALAMTAQQYLETQASRGADGIQECVPLARWGQPTDWLLYDPRGRIRGGDPGYLLRTVTREEPIESLAAALDRIEQMARETLGTN